MTLTPEQIAEGWIEWSGGECPIKDDQTAYELKLSTGTLTGRQTCAYLWNWWHEGLNVYIIAYRIIEAFGADAEPARPSDDHLWDKTLTERDSYSDTADKLAGLIAEITGHQIGEHSSANCPWRNAIEAAEQFISGCKGEAEPARPTHEEIARRLRGILDISDNHEAGLIPMASRCLIARLADEIGPSEPKRETVQCRIYVSKNAAPIATATIDLIDGKPDPSTLKIGGEA